ncbi:MAG: HPr family phosphocarrier protein [Kiloniellales bacterium]|nr:HPr family phosphocarrier protein [Kiloniellales bacterium]
MKESTSASGSAVVLDPTGLHARPAVKLTKLAKGFKATIDLRSGEAGEWINAKSPNAVMKLKARHGERLHLRAAGEDAEEAVLKLVGLIERDFAG